MNKTMRKSISSRRNNEFTWSGNKLNTLRSGTIIKRKRFIRTQFVTVLVHLSDLFIAVSSSNFLLQFSNFKFHDFFSADFPKFSNKKMGSFRVVTLVTV